MQVNPQAAMVNYLSRLRPNASRKDMYVREAQRFLRFSQGDFSRETLLDYINAIEKDNYAPSTITKVMIPTVRRVFKSNKQEWPLLPGEGPALREGDVYNPALDPVLVAKLIKVAKGHGVSRTHRTILALSTIYGLRRIEMSEISAANIDLNNRVLIVHTAKGGRERWHLIPEQILPHLSMPHRSLGQMAVSRAYWAIEKAAGVERMYEVGWHAIRRILVRLLIQAGLPGLTVDNFMRWKRGGSDMKRLYFDSVVVGEGSERTEVGKLDKDVDLAVFKVHPFLNLWSE